MNPVAIEGHLKLVLIQWIVIIAAAWLFGRLGKKFGQPLAVGEIAAGIILGPSVLGLIWPADWPVLFPKETQQSLQLLGKLGLVFLLFQVGMEFDYSHLRSKSKTVTVVSLLGMVAPFLCGLVIGPWLHEKFAPETPRFGFQFFLCIALSISALPIMGRILLEMKLERTAIGAMGISAAAIDDVIGWVLLGVATALVTSHFNVGHLLLQLVSIAVFFLVLQKWIGPALRRLWRKGITGAHDHGMSNSFLAILLICLFVCCLITHELGIFVIFGAFLFGVCLHQETSLVKAWRDRFSGLVLVAFVPIFFTNTGLNTRIGSLASPEAWLACALVLAAAVAGKLGGCYLGARLTGQPPREAGCVAALMNTRALMGLIAINIGLDLGLLTPALFTMLVIMALLTTAMCGPLLRWWLPKDLRKLVPD
ncbi:MAG TPA: cation:proton antiporter [Verrucomicrobiae bacterium]|nr:cation:proton antiporter [Verrucomicrobiae bacterium]